MLFFYFYNNLSLLEYNKTTVFLLFTFYMYNLYAQTCNEASIYFKANKYALTSEDVTEIQ